MKRLNKTETPIFLSVVCSLFPKAIFFTFILLKFNRLSGATFYYSIDTLYRFIKPFSDNKMSIFEEYGAFKGKGNVCHESI